MQPDTKARQPDSLSELLSSVNAEKKEALSLVGLARQGNNLSDEELGKIAHSIYMSTFVKALQLKYKDSDRAGNNACLNPCVQIMEEVETYRLPEEMPGSKYSIAAMGRPAFWCITSNVIDSHAYNPAKPVEGSNSMIIWRKREKIPNILELAAEYESTFQGIDGKNVMPDKTYLVSNLRNIFCGPQAESFPRKNLRPLCSP